MIYSDAATSFPKPPAGSSRHGGHAGEAGANPGRSGHRLSLCAGRVVNACREEAALLLGMEQPERVIFTGSCTEALNLAILAAYHQGDEALCSHAEHNAVMRPLHHLAQTGQIHLTVLSPDNFGILQPHTLQAAIGPRTALVVISHASNVTGVVQPMHRLGAVCKENAHPPPVDAGADGGRTGYAAGCAERGHGRHAGTQLVAWSTGRWSAGAGPGMEPLPLIRGGTGSSSEVWSSPTIYPTGMKAAPYPCLPLRGRRKASALHEHLRRKFTNTRATSNTRLRQGLSTLPGITCLGHPATTTGGHHPPFTPAWTAASLPTVWIAPGSPCAADCIAPPPSILGWVRCKAVRCAPPWASITPRRR